ncbi:SpaA isopeptide-forming pilin-related protein [Flavobacterium sp. ACN6]|uniref:SpaA isopeptide-forming pilin-related protein n=1 Tax=Flavobacterium sp. ACN6 TaxID=1920426 RepID=UPI000BB3DA8A|nr:SpaA isopeptide-forming pilin-related protein [Flavobacterium sp. ACN6]PBJ12772.1 hypothetical protein BSF42_19530 [Flavobacterium sp. ACN6]
MKKLFLIVVFVFQSFLFTSCDNDNNEIAKATLELKIKDEVGNNIKDAKVTLFSTKEDFESKSNPLGILTSDNDGKVIFDNLDTEKYYWFVEKECKDNRNGKFSSELALKGNVVEREGIIISDKTSNIEILNSNNIPLSVNINGGEYFIVNAKQYIEVPGFGLGKYTITWKNEAENIPIKMGSVEIANCGFSSALVVLW